MIEKTEKTADKTTPGSNSCFFFLLLFSYLSSISTIALFNGDESVCIPRQLCIVNFYLFSLFAVLFVYQMIRKQ